MRAIVIGSVLGALFAALVTTGVRSQEPAEFRTSVGPVSVPAPAEAGPAEFSLLFPEMGLSYAADPPPPPGHAPPAPYTQAPMGQIGVYIGGFFQPVVVPEDDLDFIDGDIGWGFTMGYAPTIFPEFLGAIGFEFSFEFSEHEDPSVNDTVDYTRLLLGFKVIDTMHEEIQPYFTFGLGFHDVDYDSIDYNIDGVGGYFGGGIDFFLDPVFSIGIDLKVHAWSGEDNSDPPAPGDGFTPTVGITFLAHF